MQADNPVFLVSRLNNLSIIDTIFPSVQKLFNKLVKYEVL